MKKILLFTLTSVLAFALLFSGSAQAYTHTVTLRLGSRGSQVFELQRTLNQNNFILATAGAGAPGFETTYFGPITRAAVIRFQIANGLAADGIVGPITGGRLAALTGGTPVLPAGCFSLGSYNIYTGKRCDGTTPSPSGPLSGTDGTIANVTELSQYNNEEVGEGEEDVRIAGLEVEASNDGDIALRSIRVSFDPSGNSGSDNLDDYVDTVSVWMNDTRIGSVNVDDFSQNNDDSYSRVIQLNNAIVRRDDSENIYIAVDAAGNFDSGDISGDSWTVDVDNIRFEDGSGVTTTDDDTGDINNMNVPINFVDFSTAADTELRISKSSDSPDEGVVIIDGDDTTDNVVLLKGQLRVSGDSDITLDELPVTLTVSGTANEVDEVTGSITLVIDGEEFTESVTTTSASATITFDDLDLTIDAGDTITFEVRADINEIDAGVFDEGDTILASITATNRDFIEAENEQGDDLDDSDEKTGTAIGETLELRSTGASLTLVSTDTDVTAGSSSNDDLGTFKIRFKVSALGDTVYVSSLTTSTGLTYVVDRAGTAVGSGLSATLVNITDDDLTSVGNYRIDEGEEETFELTVTAQLPTAGTAGQYRLALTGLKWDTDDDATPDENYTFNLDQFRTSYLALN